MGATMEQHKGTDYQEDELPAHQVELSSYRMLQTEVTQELWKYYMGNNPSVVKGDKLPVTNVTVAQIEKFIALINKDLFAGKLFDNEGLTYEWEFRLPTEAQWEFAARGGNKSGGFKFSGSSSVDPVAWYANNARERIQPVGGKNANELDLYDMSGNVGEICADRYGVYLNYSQKDPCQTSPANGDYVVRGGSAASSDFYCRVSARNHIGRDKAGNFTGFRLAMVRSNKSRPRPPKVVRTDGGEGLCFTFSNKTELVMRRVRGGTFTMGRKKGRSDEQNEHEVTLTEFYMGRNEVTNAEWDAVMGGHSGNGNLPKTNVSWNDCRQFVERLNKLVKNPKYEFDLPTEAQWEYAALGPNKKEKAPTYSGDYSLDRLAWYAENSNNVVHKVCDRLPNGYGIYDMTGNVKEWCRDAYLLTYTHGSQPDPVTEPKAGLDIVVRGGSYKSTTGTTTTFNGFQNNPAPGRPGTNTGGYYNGTNSGTYRNSTRPNSGRPQRNSSTVRRYGRALGEKIQLDLDALLPASSRDDDELRLKRREHYPANTRSDEIGLRLVLKVK